MLKLTDDAARAMHNLKGNPNWQKIVQWLKESHATLTEANEAACPYEQTYIQKGDCRTIRVIFEAAEK